jgi:transcriptional regulator of acetoin/glycerol metabolism
MAAPLTAGAAQQAAAADVAAVLATLAKTSGNVRAAAVLLGIPRRTLDRRIVSLGLREHLSATYPRAARQPAKR